MDIHADVVAIELMLVKGSQAKYSYKLGRNTEHGHKN